MTRAQEFLRRALHEKDPSTAAAELRAASTHIIEAAKILRAGAGLYKQLEIVSSDLKDTVRALGKDLDSIASELMNTIQDFEDNL